MPIMRFKANNILLFEDFEIVFSYPSKLKTSVIDNEFLSDVPSFRYKKLNIFLGSNASGKTSIIKALWKTLLFLHKKESSILKELINYEKEESNIEIDLTTNGKDYDELHRFKIKTNNKKDDIDILISHSKVKLSRAVSASDSYETKSRLLDEMMDKYRNYIDVLNELDIIMGWNLVLPATEKDFDRVHIEVIKDKEISNDYINIILKVFQTLDSAIIDVTYSKDSDNAIVLTHKYAKKIIIQDGMLISSIPKLSSGTKYGINIANIIYAIKYHRNGIYLIDEQFSYISSDIEIAMISKMVSLLGDNEQLFISTHNNDVCSTSFPFHSFYFLKKDDKISIHCGADVENRNNVSPKTIIDNDLFSIAPDVNKIFEIKEYGH